MNDTERGFWWFVCERQTIWVRRFELGLPAPWTEDPVLVGHHFTNVYRELDRGTIWFQDAIKAAGFFGQDRPWALMWAAVAYRLVNRVATFEAFGGIPAAADLDRFMEFLLTVRTGGGRVFTGRHQTRGLVSYERSLRWLLANGRALLPMLAGAEDPQQAVGLLRTVPGIGAFFANQVYLDLLESGFFPRFTEDDYIELGPGAKLGLRILFGRGNAATLQGWFKELTSSQWTRFAELGLDMPFYKGRPLTCKNMEHALCEFSKWWRIRAGARGKSGSRRVW